MALHDVKEILDELERLYGNEARPASDFCYEEPLDDLTRTTSCATRRSPT